MGVSVWDVETESRILCTSLHSINRQLFRYESLIMTSSRAGIHPPTPSRAGEINHQSPPIQRALVVCGLALSLTLGGCASSPKPSPTVPAALLEQSSSASSESPLSEKAQLEQRQAVFQMRNDALNQLFKLRPAVRDEIIGAAGYGVFEVNGLNAVLADAHGRGVVFDRASGGKPTYMQMTRTSIDAGGTLSPYWQVLVFDDPQRLSQFIAAGASSDAASDSSIKVYRLSSRGVSIQADEDARYSRCPYLN